MCKSHRSPFMAISEGDLYRRTEIAGWVTVEVINITDETYDALVRESDLHLYPEGEEITVDRDYFEDTYDLVDNENGRLLDGDFVDSILDLY